MLFKSCNTQYPHWRTFSQKLKLIFDAPYAGTNYAVAGGAVTQILFHLLQSVFQTFEHLTIVP